MTERPATRPDAVPPTRPSRPRTPPAVSGSRVLRHIPRGVGTGRQYTGTAGRIENAIVAVYADYATAHKQALVDRELYVQREWFADPERHARGRVRRRSRLRDQGPDRLGPGPTRL